MIPSFLSCPHHTAHLYLLDHQIFPQSGLYCYPVPSQTFHTCQFSLACKIHCVPQAHHTFPCAWPFCPLPSCLQKLILLSGQVNSSSLQFKPRSCHFTEAFLDLPPSNLFTEVYGWPKKNGHIFRIYTVYPHRSWNPTLLSLFVDIATLTAPRLWTSGEHGILSDSSQSLQC